MFGPSLREEKEGKGRRTDLNGEDTEKREGKERRERKEGKK